MSSENTLFYHDSCDSMDCISSDQVTKTGPKSLPLLLYSDRSASYNTTDSSTAESPDVCLPFHDTNNCLDDKNFSSFAQIMKLTGQLSDSKYAMKRMIGQGSYGIVWEALDLVSSKSVAIKAVHLNKDSLRAKRLLREIKILRRLRNQPNIITLLDVFIDENIEVIYLVFEYAASDVHKLQCSSIFLTEDDVAKAMFQLLRALKLIHSCGFLHRDLYVTQSSLIFIAPN